MQQNINTTETTAPIQNGRRCISAEEKFFQNVRFWAIQIYFFATKHYVEICLLLCVAFIMNYWKKSRSRKRKVSKRTRRRPPHTLFEIAAESYDKLTADLCVEAVEEYDYDVNYQITSKKLSLFQCACMSGNSRVMMFMIERGADVKLCTEHGDSPLYLATYGYLHSPRPDLHAISMLISCGCDVNQPNRSGYTVLHQAAGKGSLFLTQYFIFKGADPSQKNHAGLLPYHIAVMEEHKEVASFLKDRLKPKRVPSTV